MRVLAIRNSFLDCPVALHTLGFSNESQVALSIDKEYTVWALSRFQGMVFFQVINDVDYPDWVPAWLFRVIDNTIPAGWVFNVFDDNVEMVLGPDFIASDQQAYDRMVELHPTAVVAFWSHVKTSMTRSEDTET